MGILIYGNNLQRYALADRTLAHVQSVVVAKLRRNEPFALAIDPDQGGRETLWIHATIPLTFRYSAAKPISMNREWLTALMSSASSTAGMQIVSEPVPAVLARVAAPSAGAVTDADASADPTTTLDPIAQLLKPRMTAPAYF